MLCPRCGDTICEPEFGCFRCFHGLEGAIPDEIHLREGWWGGRLQAGCDYSLCKRACTGIAPRTFRLEEAFPLPVVRVVNPRGDSPEKLWKALTACPERRIWWPAEEERRAAAQITAVRRESQKTLLRQTLSGPQDYATLIQPVLARIAAEFNREGLVILLLNDQRVVVQAMVVVGSREDCPEPWDRILEAARRSAATQALFARGRCHKRAAEPDAGEYAHAAAVQDRLRAAGVTLLDYLLLCGTARGRGLRSLRSADLWQGLAPGT